MKFGTDVIQPMAGIDDQSNYNHGLNYTSADPGRRGLRFTYILCKIQFFGKTAPFEAVTSIMETTPIQNSKPQTQNQKSNSKAQTSDFGFWTRHQPEIGVRLGGFLRQLGVGSSIPCWSMSVFGNRHRFPKVAILVISTLEIGDR